MIANPILPGFHPDPSILRVGADFFIATSTFEWFPGIRIHTSRDLAHWNPLGFALERPSQLDLKGCDASTGVWAPCLTYDDQAQMYYLAFTVMRGWSGNQFDLDNFVVTAQHPSGPWSEPVYLNSSGFDPSFFHENGQHWLVNLEWETRPGFEHPGPIVVQEFDSTTQKLLGEAKRISRGSTHLGCQEGPHLFRRGSWYYLMTAEGGTGFGHAVAMARSLSLEGPWESDPHNPILTAAKEVGLDRRGIDDYLKPYQDNLDLPLQKCGHGSLVETQTGEWYLAHLCARPIGTSRRSILGRETALQKMIWTDDGWLRLAHGGVRPQSQVESPRIEPALFPSMLIRDSTLSIVASAHWQTLRGPADETWVTPSRTLGHLSLRGRESLGSRREVSLVARRLQSFHVRVQTLVDFQPSSYRQSAGLVWYYDEQMFYAARLTWDEVAARRILSIWSCDNGLRTEPGPSLDTSDWAQVHLRAQLYDGNLQFFGSPDERAWVPVGPTLDATKCSDEYSKQGHFTGTFVGLFCQDALRRDLWAQFTYFDYEESSP